MGTLKRENKVGNEFAVTTRRQLVVGSTRLAVTA